MLVSYGSRRDLQPPAVSDFADVSERNSLHSCFEMQPVRVWDFNQKTCVGFGEQEHFVKALALL